MTYHDATADAMIATLEEDPKRWDVYLAMSDRLEEIGHEDAIAYRWAGENERHPHEKYPSGCIWFDSGIPEAVWHKLPIYPDDAEQATFAAAFHRLAVGLRRSGRR